MALFSKLVIHNRLYCTKSLKVCCLRIKILKLVACVQSVTARESFHSWFQFVALPQRQSFIKLNKPLDMKRIQAMKNSEKIWKLEYWIPAANPEPDEQNKVKEHNQVQDVST